MTEGEKQIDVMASGLCIQGLGFSNRYTKLPSCGEDDDGEAGQGGLSVASSQSDHCHTPKPGNRASRKAMTKLIVACCLTTLFMIGEAVGGYLANSIAIMSDAAHLLSDLTSFIVSLVAIFIGMQPASRKMNFGYHRAEVLGAVVSVLMIWLITGILVYAAVERVTSMDFEVESDVMIIVSALGVVINIILGVVLHTGSGGHGHSHGGHGHSHGASSEQQSSGSNTNVNVRAAFIHIIGDLLQSIGVLIAAYVIKFYPDYKIADPICTFIFSVLVIVTTIPIMRDLSHVLMEGTPHGIDYATVSNNLMTIQGVKMVHSLNIWALTLDKNACSVHLAISAESDHDTVLRDAQRVIRSRHQIYQTTIQVERYEPLQMDSCQQCQPLSK
ncbi:proton-coupled zinc antiporter SLC30A2-like isoform X3 [Palaemon carinicauda]|uniref:proton-coupled zinc antiporter SLC30A2-like isoform X3 n=1 Tax=Palaemon carinicauda TaxID=392227 RepID=UPI0035B5B705